MTRCNRKDCRCTHEPPCEAGWIETETRDVRGVTYDQVKPCPACRGDVAALAAQAKDREDFQNKIRNMEDRERAASQTAWDD